MTSSLARLWRVRCIPLISGMFQVEGFSAIPDEPAAPVNENLKANWLAIEHKGEDLPLFFQFDECTPCDFGTGTKYSDLDP